jgi:hypothetical protein
MTPQNRSHAIIDGTSLDVPASSGGFVVREMVRFAFFVRKPHLDVAPAATEAFSRLIDAFPPPSLSMFAIASGDWLDYDAKGLKAQVRKRLIGRDKAENGTASVWGEQANIPDFTVEYTGSAIDVAPFKQQAAALWFSIAATEFAEHRDTALQLWREFVMLLDCSAAYVDLALEGDRRRTQAIAKRYRHVDSEVEDVAWDLANKLPGVFWRNYLGPKLVAAMGGRGAIVAALSPNAEIEDVANRGLVITLGKTLSRGDVNRRGGDTDREVLARLAHKHGMLHVPRKVTYFKSEEQLSNKEAQQKWHLRFVE